MLGPRAQPMPSIESQLEDPERVQSMLSVRQFGLLSCLILRLCCAEALRLAPSLPLSLALHTFHSEQYGHSYLCKLTDHLPFLHGLKVAPKACKIEEEEAQKASAVL